MGIDNTRDDADYKSEEMKYRKNLLAETFKVKFRPDKNYSNEELLNN